MQRCTTYSFIWGSERVGLFCMYSIAKLYLLYYDNDKKTEKKHSPHRPKCLSAFPREHIEKINFANNVSCYDFYNSKANNF
jgi:hypothetical protein